VKIGQNSNELSTSGLISGTYIVRVVDVNGASISKNIIID
jgi:hypothetical protein